MANEWRQAASRDSKTWWLCPKIGESLANSTPACLCIHFLPRPTANYKPCCEPFSQPNEMSNALGLQGVVQSEGSNQDIQRGKCLITTPQARIVAVRNICMSRMLDSLAQKINTMQ